MSNSLKVLQEVLLIKKVGYKISLSLAKKFLCQALYEIHFMHKMILFTMKEYAKQKYNKNCFGYSQKCFIIHRQYLLLSNFKKGRKKERLLSNNSKIRRLKL